MTPPSIARRIGALLAAALLAACAGDASDAGLASAPTSFGTTREGEPVNLYTLRNANGMEARVTDFGGIITSLLVPDRAGELGDVVLGFDAVAGYESDEYRAANPYFGALIGRYGNRIANGRFTLDGETYQLARNNGPNHLHGGNQGFDQVVWEGEPTADGTGLVLTYVSRAGEEGYPGTLTTQVTYTLTDRNELVIDYHATTDRATPVNLTQHSYFNLAGAGSGDILGHLVTIEADHFTPVDSTLIPTGELRAVEGTPFDFRTPTPIGDRIDANDPQIRFGPGYDHNFVLRSAGGAEPALAATVYEPTSGRVMEVLTTEPGLQFYSGNFLDGTLRGKDDAVYGHRHGFAMETQHFPDSPNHPSFPSSILRPGEEYRSRTIYRFSTRD